MTTLEPPTSYVYTIRFMEDCYHVKLIDFHKTYVLWVGTAAGMSHEYITAIDVPNVGPTSTRLVGFSDDDYGMTLTQRLVRKCARPVTLLWGLTHLPPEAAVHLERQLHLILSDPKAAAINEEEQKNQ